jgi:DeoR/GlpR family transcriptional regulator of sugar metabolism
VALVTFAPASDVDLLVTDAPAEHDVVRRLRDLDVEVLHVQPSEKEMPS